MLPSVRSSTHATPSGLPDTELKGATCILVFSCHSDVDQRIGDRHIFPVLFGYISGFWRHLCRQSNSGQGLLHVYNKSEIGRSLEARLAKPALISAIMARKPLITFEIDLGFQVVIRAGSRHLHCDRQAPHGTKDHRIDGLHAECTGLCSEDVMLPNMTKLPVEELS